MLPVPPLPRLSASRTFLVAMTLLGVVAVGESGVLAWYLFFRSPAKPPVTSVSTSSAAPMQAEEKRLLAEAAEKSLVAGLAKPTPPSAPVTPAARVADLINLARTLRERGDMGTAMVRLREAQGIYLNYAPIISEMGITYEKMGLTDKAMQQWRRIYEMGEKAGIYYAAAEAKLRMLQLPDPTPEEMPAPRSLTGGTPAAVADAPPETRPVLTLGNVGTTDDTGNSQPLRRLKLRVPIQARPGSHVEPREAVIQVFFYDQLKDGTLVETNANVVSSWTHRTTASGDVLPVDWSSPDPEVLEVEYAQPAFNPKAPHERRNYFGYSVRVYYKGMLDAKFANPVKLLNQFIPPASLPSADLPR